jgi:hypothetical protein
MRRYSELAAPDDRGLFVGVAGAEALLIFGFCVLTRNGRAFQTSPKNKSEFTIFFSVLLPAKSPYQWRPAALPR